MNEKNHSYRNRTRQNSSVLMEIERLHELVDAGREDRKAIDELVDENLRLRELLKGVVDDMVIGEDWEHLLGEIKKEVGDE